MNKILVTFIISALAISVILALPPKAGAAPLIMKRLFHLFSEPDDLYEPIAEDRFNFWQQGYSKEYLLSPKYEDSYSISIVCTDPDYIPSGWGTKNKYQFKGKIKVEFHYQGNPILIDEITKEKAVFYQKGSMEHLRKIDLFSFDIPLQKKYKQNLLLRLTVIEPDGYLESYGKSLKMTIGVTQNK